jgi:hypothetical protein
MKRILFFLLFVAAVGICHAVNTLTLGTASGHPGDTVSLTLSLTNTSSISAMQTFIPLGTQLQYVTGSCTLTNRGSSHQVTASVQNDTLRIYSYSLSLATYSGSSGALLTFRVVLGNEPATYNLPLVQPVLSSSTGSSITVQTTAGSVTIQSPKIGMTSASVDFGHYPIRSTYTRNVTVRNLGNEPLTLYGLTFDNAALSCSVSNVTIAGGGTRNITITYAPMQAGSITMHAVLHSNAKVGDSVLTITANPYAVNELRPLTVTGETDSIVTIELRMNNMDSIVALQTSIKMPAALTYIPGSFAVNSSRSHGHTATAGMLGDTLTMIVTNLQNYPLHGGDGVVASFQVRLHGYGYCNIQLLETSLSDSAGHNVLSAVYTGRVNINSPTLNCGNQLDIGSTPVTDTARATFTIRNTGNAPMTLSQVAFTQSGYSISESLPMTVAINQNATLHVNYCGTTAGDCSSIMQLYTNDPRNTLKEVSLTCWRYEPNALYMTTNPANGVDSAMVSIALDNYSDITALQMDIVYPHRYATIGSNDIHLTGRSNGHLVSSAQLNDSTWRVLAMSMTNSLFNGNSGPVLDLHLHLSDTNDHSTQLMQLHNVMAANQQGVNMITLLDSVAYIATQVVHDTLVQIVHDTTIVVENVYIHDTTVVDHYIYDTMYIQVHDTTYLWHYDTIVVDNYIHDTTYLWHYDTIVVDNYIHDTTVIHDTTIINNYIHDTTYVDNFIYDTVVIMEPIDYYNLNLSTVPEDYGGIVVGSGQYSENTVVEIVAIPSSGYHFVRWNDDNTDNPRHVTMTHNMTLYAYFYRDDVGIADVQPSESTITVQDNVITVQGAAGQRVRIFDAIGRLLFIELSVPEMQHFRMVADGVYLVQVGDGVAQRVVVR